MALISMFRTIMKFLLGFIQYVQAHTGAKEFELTHAHLLNKGNSHQRLLRTLQTESIGNLSKDDGNGNNDTRKQ